MNKQYWLLIGLLIMVLMLSGCANVENINECRQGYQYNFWYGLWHGLIFPFSFIGSIFSKDIAVYAVNNNGVWYDFGFFIGVGGLQSGILKSLRSNNKYTAPNKQADNPTVIEVDEVKQEPVKNSYQSSDSGGGEALPPSSASKPPPKQDDDDEYIDYTDIDPRLN